jgi:hypothetical protein
MDRLDLIPTDPTSSASLITPLCQAKSKQSGLQCKNFATKGKQVCRFHGGKSTGAKTLKGRKRQKKANITHGLRTKEAIAENQQVREWIKSCKASIRL